MPYKDPNDKKKYNKSYYWRHRKRLRAYARQRREEQRKAWQKWYAKKKDKERREKINFGQIYKPKSAYR